MRHTPYKGTNVEDRKNFEEKTILRVHYEQTLTNQRTDIDVKKITLVSYDIANVWRYNYQLLSYEYTRTRTNVEKITINIFRLFSRTEKCRHGKCREG